MLIASLLTVAAVGEVGAMAFECLRRRRRTNVLGRAAHGRHVRFAVEDPLDIPGHYRRFAIMQTGHDVCACNVCDAPSDLGRARTFDLHIHVGLAGRRTCRRYAVAIIELARDVDVAGSPASADGEGATELVDRRVLACVPMGRPPQDHAEALARATRHVSRAPTDRVCGKC